MRGTKVRFSKFTPNSSDLSNELFKQWRSYRFWSGFLGSLAIIPSGFDYELSFNTNRKMETCLRANDSLVLLRILTLLLSLSAILMLIPYKVAYYEWMKYIIKTYNENPSFVGASYRDIIQMKRKRTLKDYFLEDNLWIAILLFLIFPYPGEKGTFFLGQQYIYKRVYVCYYFSEVAYAIMYLRLYFLAFSFFNYGKLQSNFAKSIAKQYGVQKNIVFSIKCYINTYPLKILFLGFIIPNIIIFGNLLRIFERPLRILDFDTIGNAFWYIFTTITTIGYGDYYAVSTLGRIVVVFSLFWGLIIESLTFVSIGSILQLKTNEVSAYKAITIGRKAAMAISGALFNGKHKYSTYNGWNKVRNLLNHFLRQKKYDTTFEYFYGQTSSGLCTKIESIEAKADKIKEKLNKLENRLA